MATLIELSMIIRQDLYASLHMQAMLFHRMSQMAEQAHRDGLWLGPEVSLTDVRGPIDESLARVEESNRQIARMTGRQLFARGLLRGASLPDDWTAFFAKYGYQQVLQRFDDYFDFSLEQLYALATKEGWPQQEGPRDDDQSAPEVVMG